VIRRVLALALLARTALGAQATAGATLEVRVRDYTGGYVPLATVSAEFEGVRQQRISTDSGRVSFTVPVGARIRVAVRRIGYVPFETSLTLRDRRQQLELTISRTTAQSLDTVRVIATRSVSGIVVNSATQEPVRGASVAFSGTGMRVMTGEDGVFTMPLQAQRNITLSVRAEGFAPAFRAERLDGNASGQFLILLDSMNRIPKQISIGLWDAERRMGWRSTRDVVIGGRELRSTGARSAFDAVRQSASAAERGLRAGDNLCLWINGEAAPGQTLESIDAERVKTLELYTNGGEMLRDLMDRWPRGAPCGRQSAALSATGAGAVRVAVVWTY
jgi:hypothetical protein